MMGYHRSRGEGPRGGGSGESFFLLCYIYTPANQSECSVWHLFYCWQSTHKSIQIHEGGGELWWVKPRGEGTKGCGGVVSHFIDCAIHQQTNQCEVFRVFFIADKALTKLYMFMREMGSCDESYQGEGDLMIVVNHHSHMGMGDMGLLTCHIPAWTNIDNAGGSDDNV